MILKRFYDDFLAQASFLVGCERTRDAIVIDPNRSIETYTRAAAEARLRITKVTETHIHADFLSGCAELAAATGAEMCVSDMGNAEWHYVAPEKAGFRLLKHGDVIQVGSLKLEVVHTPGHTPEHIVFVVTDTTISDSAIGAFTGDFIFAGDVGRPDLLEKAAGISGTMRDGAAQLYHSLQSFARRPDYLQLWPGHGAGSACGKSLGAMPQSTLGYEKLANWAFNAKSEADFINRVLEGQPDPPRYFAEMKRVNREGVPPRTPMGLLPEISDTTLRELSSSGEIVIDTRSTDVFAEAHLPGSINVPLNKSFASWAGSIIPYGRDFYLIVDGPEEVRLAEARAALQLIGLDRVAGYASAGALERMAGSSQKLGSLPQMDVKTLHSMQGVQILDVRTQSEHSEGHIAGSIQLALQSLASHLDKLDPSKPVAIHCAGGTRSAIASSVLRANGFTNVTNVTGGFGAWAKAGLPVEKA